MLKIRLLKDGNLVGTLDAKWTLDIADIANSADKLGPEHGADDWEVVNDAGGQILTKARWSTMRH
jgi:hypothetical protein